VNFGIKHVQGLPISYTRGSTNLHDEYENYWWKVTKDGDGRDRGPEEEEPPDVSGALWLYHAGRRWHDLRPDKQERAIAEVTVTRRKQQKNGAR